MARVKSEEIPSFKEYSKRLTIHEPIILLNTKISKKIFWMLCDDLYSSGALKNSFVITIAMCSNALTDYLSYQEKLRRPGNKTVDEDGNISPYINLRNGAEARFLRTGDKLGLSPKAYLSLKLDMSDDGEEEEDAFG